MAEPHNISIELNDTSYVSLVNQNESSPMESDLFNTPLENSLLFVQEINDLTDPSADPQKSTSPTENSNPAKEVSDSGNLSTSNEEQAMDSPTTQENYTFKCVFCDQILTATDCPKLLECLHNTCINCLNNKLFDNDSTTERGKSVCPALS